MCVVCAYLCVMFVQEGVYVSFVEHIGKYLKYKY